MQHIQSEPYSLLVGGAWRAGAEGKQFVVHNPATAQPLATVHEASAADVDAAVRAAHEAYRGAWRRTSPRKRAFLLRRLASLIERDAEKLAWIETYNVGKPISLSRDSIKAIPPVIDYYAGILPALRGETIPVADTAVLNFTLREPLGVCALVMPWNYPLTLAINKLAPALAAGNVAVIKPSEITPLSTIELARLALEAGFPEGVVNVVNGPGPTVGNALVTHPLVARVSFTGGTKTGAAIAAAAGAGIKHVTLELGGKSPLIVFDDADIPGAARVAANDLMRNSGQVCIACTRLIVQQGAKDRFIDELENMVQRIRIGAPEQADTEMGPLVSRAQLERVQHYVRGAVSEGAKPRNYLDSEQLQRLGAGYYMPPTLLLDARNDMTSARDEIFGPVQSVIAFENEEEAVRLANDSRYGLAAIVYCRDGSRALRVARALESGNVAINTGLRASFDAPFGGYKQSGIGREQGLEALYENTQLKNIRFHTGG